MKRLIALMLMLTLLLCGCGAKGEPAVTEAPAAVPETTAAPTAEPTTEPTTVPTTEPAPVYVNPLNGEILDAPFTGRIFANTVSNLADNIPHVGVVKADMLIECYVNMDSVVRCLALFTDIDSVDAIGSTRSTRPMFNAIAQHYDLILSHAGGSDQALKDAKDRGVENFNIDAWAVASTGASYRDKERKGAYENTLYGIGSGIKAYAEAQGYPMTLERDYGFSFTDDGTPAEGVEAKDISITLTYKKAKKETRMVYDESTGKYAFNQYGQVMTDLKTEEVEAFRNVIVMYADITTTGIYHIADFTAGGTGYFACGGKLIPITWSCAGDKEPFRFFTESGEPLELGRGNTYMAICTPESPVVCEGMPEQPAETTEAAS
jgi:hypothetical protein